MTIEVPLHRHAPGAEILTSGRRVHRAVPMPASVIRHTPRRCWWPQPGADSPAAGRSACGRRFAPAGSAPPLSDNAATLPAEVGDRHEELDAQLGDNLGLNDVGEDDILAPEDAFKVSASSTDGNRLQVQWTIADGTYLYQDKIKLQLAGDACNWANSACRRRTSRRTRWRTAASATSPSITSLSTSTSRWCAATPPPLR